MLPQAVLLFAEPWEDSLGLGLELYIEEVAVTNQACLLGPCRDFSNDPRRKWDCGFSSFFQLGKLRPRRISEQVAKLHEGPDILIPIQPLPPLCGPGCGRHWRVFLVKVVSGW